MYSRTDPPHQIRARRDGRRWQRWCLEHGVLLLAVVALIYSAIVFQAKGARSEWHECFIRAARYLLAHETIHRPQEEGCYSYPPVMALLAAPLANWSTSGSLWAWWAVNVAAACAWMTCAWRLAGGPKIERLTNPWRLILALALVTMGRWTLTVLEHQQFDLVIAALLVGGCYLLWRGHSIAAAGLMGAAAAMKCTPLLFVPYLCWRRKPGAALVLVAVAVGLNVLPDILLPKADGGSYLSDWVRFVSGEIGATAPGSWRSDMLLNQSLGGYFNRLLRFGLPFSSGALQAEPLAAWATPWLRVATYGTSLLLVAATAWRLGRPWLPPQIVSAREPLPVDSYRLRLGWETSAVMCLMLLLSPMTSKAHFVVLLLPGLLLARQLVERPSTTHFVIQGLLFVCGPLTIKGLTGKPLGDLTLAWGLPMWFVLVVWYGTWRALAESNPMALRRSRKLVSATRAA